MEEEDPFYTAATVWPSDDDSSSSSEEEDVAPTADSAVPADFEGDGLSSDEDDDDNVVIRKPYIPEAASARIAQLGCTFRSFNPGRHNLGIYENKQDGIIVKMEPPIDCAEQPLEARLKACQACMDAWAAIDCPNVVKLHASSTAYYDDRTNKIYPMLVMDNCAGTEMSELLDAEFCKSEPPNYDAFLETILTWSRARLDAFFAVFNATGFAQIDWKADNMFGVHDQGADGSPRCRIIFIDMPFTMVMPSAPRLTLGWEKTVADNVSAQRARGEYIADMSHYVGWWSDNVMLTKLDEWQWFVRSAQTGTALIALEHATDKMTCAEVATLFESSLRLCKNQKLPSLSEVYATKRDAVRKLESRAATEVAKIHAQIDIVTKGALAAINHELAELRKKASMIQNTPSKELRAATGALDVMKAEIKAYLKQGYLRTNKPGPAPDVYIIPIGHEKEYMDFHQADKTIAALNAYFDRPAVKARAAFVDQ